MRDLAWRVYLLRCADGTLYCGCTNDLDKRLAAHARGRVKYTRGRLPVELAHVEPVADKSAALKREHAWKRLPRTEKLRRIAAAAAPQRRPSAKKAPRGPSAKKAPRGPSAKKAPHGPSAKPPHRPSAQKASRRLIGGRKTATASACGKLQD